MFDLPVDPISKGAGQAGPDRTYLPLRKIRNHSRGSLAHSSRDSSRCRSRSCSRRGRHVRRGFDSRCQPSHRAKLREAIIKMKY